MPLLDIYGQVKSIRTVLEREKFKGNTFGVEKALEDLSCLEKVFIEAERLTNYPHNPEKYGNLNKALREANLK